MTHCHYGRFDTPDDEESGKDSVHFRTNPVGRVCNAAIGNADMHLKNCSVIYPDTRYDFLSTIAYIKDRETALSVAKEKDTKKLDQPVLERIAVKAGLPKRAVTQTAPETAEKTVRAWSEMAATWHYRIL